MTAVLRLLAFVGGKGQFMLIAGLLGGLAFPQAAGLLRLHLTELIVALLFFAALRIEPRQLLAIRAAFAHDLAIVAALQLVTPILTAAAIHLAGLEGPAATILMLIAMASGITGTPPIAQMLGYSGAVATRLLVLGTLLLPLTSILPLRLAFEASAGVSLVEPALRLAAIIVVAVGGAACLRATLLRTLSAQGEQALGGVSAILLAVFVLALMDAVQPALVADPWHVAALLAFVCAVGFGMQIVTVLAYRRLAPGTPDSGEVGAVAIVAGNRNLALFLAALPAAQMDPLMLLVGCYQIPMYLTPVIMRPVYRRLLRQPHMASAPGAG